METVIEDAEVIEEAGVQPTGQALARPGGALTVAQRDKVAGLLRPVAAPQEVLAAQNETRQLIEQALQRGRDYDTIPGTGKPSLLKPGGERIAAAMGCYPRYRVLEREIDHDRAVEFVKRRWEWHPAERGKKVWTEEPGSSTGLYRYVIECEIVHRGSGVVIGQGVGSCSTMESKYIDRPRDCENTVLKMAEKRAFVGATLNAFGLSDQFTQDTEDNPDLYAERDRPTTGNGGDTQAVPTEPEARCPKCGGAMWDNRKGKRSPKAPDFKCRDKACDGVYWPGQWPPALEAASDDDLVALNNLVNRVTKREGDLSAQQVKALAAARGLVVEDDPPAKRVRAAIDHLAGIEDDLAGGRPGDSEPAADLSPNDAA